MAGVAEGDGRGHEMLAQLRRAREAGDTLHKLPSHRRGQIARLYDGGHHLSTCHTPSIPVYFAFHHSSKTKYCGELFFCRLNFMLDAIFRDPDGKLSGWRKMRRRRPTDAINSRRDFVTRRDIETLIILKLQMFLSRNDLSIPLFPGFGFQFVFYSLSNTPLLEGCYNFFWLK